MDMDSSEIAYLVELADTIYAQALEFDKAGDQFLCTLMLGLAIDAMTAIHDDTPTD